MGCGNFRSVPESSLPVPKTGYVREARAVLVVRGAARASRGRDQEAAATDHQGRERQRRAISNALSFQFPESRHVWVMHGRGMKHRCGGPGRISSTPLPAIPTESIDFFGRQRYTNLVDRMHHDNCAWITGGRIGRRPLGYCLDADFGDCTMQQSTMAARAAIVIAGTAETAE
jgi:hypothetical protein